MKNRRKSGALRRGLFLLLSAALVPALLTGCGDQSGKKAKLDPKNPVTISVWHYYNGAIMNAFEAMAKEFNETVGAQEGIIVECYGMGNVSELEKAVIASAKQEVGSMDMPNIFASYADTAYEAEKMSILADLGEYLSEKEQAEYVDAYLEEGRIGLNGELRIFPVAKSTEVFMLNATDWAPFAEAHQLAYGDLATVEGVTRISRLYYEWTDAQTPDVPDDGKAFYGRDAMANLFIIASKEFGVEIFSVTGGAATLRVDGTVMRKIWDNYYLPYIGGCYTAYGRYRSDDAKVGDILAYVGSTASASYFPAEVTAAGQTYPVEAVVLPVTHFEGAEKAMVQQGAGMVVTKADPLEEYASVQFLKWFTQTRNNIRFAALSGYMPVKKDAVDYDTLMKVLEESGQTVDKITRETLRIALEEMRTTQLYTSKAFDGGAAARSVLERGLQDKAVADREAVLALMAGGSTYEEALAQFDTDENFEAWLRDLTATLEEAIE